MKVVNIHERELNASAEAVGMLIDTISSKDSCLWPKDLWPRMQLDRPLAVGAAGGHGPIRYTVEEYEPGRFVKFRFTGPKGFDGFHAMELDVGAGPQVVLRHRLEMTTRSVAIVSWPLLFEPLHDALVEDALTTAEVSLGLPPRVRPWSLRVKMLRWFVLGGKARPQG